MGFFSWVHVVRGGEMMDISLRGTMGTRNDNKMIFCFHGWAQFIISGEDLQGVKCINSFRKVVMYMMETVLVKLLES